MLEQPTQPKLRLMEASQEQSGAASVLTLSHDKIIGVLDLTRAFLHAAESFLQTPAKL